MKPAIGCLLVCALIAAPRISLAQIFVTQGTFGATSIGQYNFDGTTANASLVSGLTSAAAVAISGDDMFIVDSYVHSIGQYKTTGEPVNPTLIANAGLNQPIAVAISNANMYVANSMGD